MYRAGNFFLLSFPVWMACSESSETGVPAIVDENRSTHFFDHPFPTDALLGMNGNLDISDYPSFGLDLTLPIIEGWKERASLATNGYGNSTASYFRFEGPLNVPTETAGVPSDSVLLIDLDTAELIPLKIQFTTETLGDPYLAENLLALAPKLGHLPASGARLGAVVLTTSGATAPENGQTGVTEELSDALSRAGVTDSVAVATTFHTQTGIADLEALAKATDQWATGRDWSSVEFKRVVSISYSQGQTPSGNDATVFTARFEDGTESFTYLSALNDEAGNHSVDLLSDWPMAVYEAQLPVPNFSGLDDQPYMSPGLTHVFDAERLTGWIDFDEDGLPNEPEEDATRLVVALPLDEAGEPLQDVPVIVYDHGTGGHAYNAIQRRNVNDDGLALAHIINEEQYAIIGRDAAIYGTRYPLIDEGYNAYLGFYNIVNAPAFRDNQRQTATEGHLLLRFIQDGLNEQLPSGSINPNRIRRMGHSMGSVTSNLGVAASPESWESVFLSGTGGLFIEYFLETGLIDTFDSESIASIFTLLGAETPDVVTSRGVFGAALGLPAEAWTDVNRLHPVATLFQWLMDPSDPMTIAQYEAAPVTILLGEGDWQVPNFTTDALHEALPNSEMIVCTPTGTYDPHYCLHRETVAFDAFRAWLTE